MYSGKYDISISNLNFIEGWGANGVDIFFVLSGFIMAYIQHNKKLSPTNFIKQRIIRIYPLYFILTIFILLISIIFPKNLNLGDGAIAIGLHSIASLLFLSQIVLGKIPILYDGWTLEYEILFYLILFLGMMFFKEMKIFIFLIISIFFLVLFCSLDSIALEFVIGYFVAIIYNQRMARNNIFSYAMIFLGSILLIFGLFFSMGSYEIIRQRALISGVPAAILIFGLVGVRQAKSGIFTLLGDSSYSIYLTQVFSIPAFYAAVKYFHLQGLVSGDLLSITCLFSTAICGVLSYFFIERNFISRLRMYAA